MQNPNLAHRALTPALAAWSACLLAPCPARAQKVFPPDAAVNVTLPPYGAVPNDGKDDTAAIQRAISENGGTVYLPAGTYNLSGPIEWKDTRGKWQAHRVLQGAGPGHTVLRLKDRCAGFTNAGSPKAVVKTASQNDNGDGTGNQGFENGVYDLSINTGVGNTGAIGVDFLANNWGAVENVAIVSGDPARVGARGLSLRRYGPGPCLIKSVTITGFDYGIDLDHWEYSVTAEHVTLNHQRVLGIRNLNNALTIRDLISDQNLSGVPVLSNPVNPTYGTRSGLVTLIGARLTGGSSANAAIDNASGLYARDVTTTGYRVAVRSKGADVPGANVAEFSSDGYGTVHDSPAGHLRLPVEETPTYHDGDLNNWAKVGPRMTGENDDTNAIQRALDSGKSTVYFPRGRVYYVADTLRVRGNVRRVFGSNVEIKPAATHYFTDVANPKPVFRFESPNDPVTAVTLERVRVEFWDVYGSGSVEHASARPVAIKDSALHASGFAYRNAPGAGKCFIENVASDGWRTQRWFFRHGQQAWARQLNPETSGPMITNDGATLWILGLKTEGAETALETRNGGSTELLGALLYPLAATDRPAIIIHEARFSGTLLLSGANNYNYVVRETRNGVTHDYWRNQLVGGRLLPLYTGYPL
jgi:hypothetical protein